MRNDVRDLRTARALSQGALAAALGVSRQTINAIETGRYLPSLPLAMHLARFFETTVEDLFHPDSGDVASEGLPDSSTRQPVTSLAIVVAVFVAFAVGGDVAQGRSSRS